MMLKPVLSAMLLCKEGKPERKKKKNRKGLNRFVKLKKLIFLKKLRKYIYIKYFPLTFIFKDFLKCV